MNTLFILLDDIGAEYLPWSPPGIWNGKLRMPNLQAHCAGVRRVYTMPACSQTRASIITGMLPRDHGIGEVLDDPADPYFMSWDFPSIFRNYDRAGAFGKWHLVAPEHPRRAWKDPLKRGVDAWLLSTGNIDNYYDWGASDEFNQSHEIYEYSSDVLCKFAGWFLDESNGNSLCWLAPHAAHAPWHTPPSGTYTTSVVDPETSFIAAAESFDYFFGKMWESLPSAVKLNTRIMAMSDNGTPSDFSAAPDGTGKGTTGEWGTRTYLMDSHQVGDVKLPISCLHLFGNGIPLTPIVMESFKPNGLNADFRLPWKCAAIWDDYKLRRNIKPVGVENLWRKISNDSLDEVAITRTDVPDQIATTLEAWMP